MKDELIAWMDDRDIAPEALSERMGVSLKTVYNWRTAGVPERKRDHLQRVMKQWDLHPDSHLAALVVRPTQDQFNRWEAAAHAADQGLERWAIESLDRLAADESQIRELPRKVAEDPKTYGGEKNCG